MIEGENESNIEYKENDIVWVKVKGYPWWPSIIKHISFRNIQSYDHNIKEKIYTIELIGEKINTKVSKDKIESFKKNYDQHINTKNISLLKSIETANKIYDKKNNTKIVYLKENAQEKNNRKEKDLININNQNVSSKKFIELNEGKNITEKENEKNIKYLQKKRINEKVILDDDNNTDNNDDNRSNITNKNKEDIKIIPTQKNNIKINININVTTNNQNTVNINSFHPTDVISQKNNPNNNIIQNPTFNPINISSLSSNEKNIIINNINDNNNIKEAIKLDEESLINSIEKEKNGKNDKKEEKEKEKKNDSEESIDEENEWKEENDDDIITNDFINETIQKLLNYQIQMSNNSSQKMISNELCKLFEKLNELFDKNQNNSHDLDIYNLTKDLIPILITFTYYNKNNDILVKSSEILSFLNEKIIKEIFTLSPNEQQKLIDTLNTEDKDINKAINKDKGIDSKDDDSNNKININDMEEKDFKEGMKIVEMISQKNMMKSNISEPQHISFAKKGRPKKNSINSDISSELFSSNLKEGNNIFNFSEKSIYDEFIKIISCQDKDKMENDFNELSGNFFDSIYDKNNNDLDTEMAKIRKSSCLKIFKLVHKIFPEINIDFLKKIIIYFEYKIRSDNSNLYSSKINTLFEIIKERFFDKTK